MLKLLSAEDLANIPVYDLGTIIDEPDPSSGDTCRSCAAYRPEPQLSGNLQVDPEIHLPSPGFPVDIAYFYNAASNANGPFGYSRTASVNMTAQASGSPTLVTLTRSNGSQVSFAYSSGAYVAQTPGCLTSLTQDTVDGYWKETTYDGMVTAYPLNTTGQITSIAYQQDSVGNAHSYSYSSGLLQDIQDPSGRRVSFSYSSGLLSAIEDWAGRITTFQYNTTSASPLNLLTTVTGPTGCQTEYQYSTFTQYSAGSYSSKWLLSGIVDPNGYGTSYAFDMQSRVNSRTIPGDGIYTYLYQPGFMTTVDPLGGFVTNTLGSNYVLLSTQNQLGNITTFTSNGNLQETTRSNPFGNVSSTTYSGKLISCRIDPLGNSTTYSYDAYNNITGYRTPDGAIWTNVYGYAGSGFDTTGAKRRLQAVISPLGYIASYGYNGRGQKTWEQDSSGYITSYNYDSFGNVISKQDALGNFWTSTFDLAGNTIARTNPLGATWSQTFDNRNRPLVATDPLANVTQYGYDSVGNLTAKVTPNGNRTTWTFNGFDKISTQQDALGNVSTNLFDIIGRRIASIDPLGNLTSTVYDAASQVIAVQNPLGAFTSNVWDIAGRQIATINPLGYYSTTVYDYAGRPVAAVDPLGNYSTTIYDINSRVVASQNPLGFFRTTVFDIAGQPIAQLDALSNRSTTTFDGRGLAIAQTDPLGRTSSTTYNGNRKVLSSTDPAGYIASQIIDTAGRAIASVDARGYYSSSTFDAANRPIASIDALGNIGSTIYDADSNAVQSIDPLNRISTRVYDALDRSLASISPFGFTTTVVRDAAGRTIATQNAQGVFSTTVFDTGSRPIAAISPLGYYSTSIYDVANRPIAGQNALGYISTIVRDANGRQAASINPLGYYNTSIFDAASQTIASIDALGNRVSNVFAPNGWTVATQDARGYFTSFIRDAAGQRICVVDANNGRSTSLWDVRGLEYAKQDQLGAFTSFTHDANRNTILRVDARNWPTSYTADPLNRTAQTLYVDGTRVTNTWDQAGEQLTSQDSTGITGYVWDLDGRKTATQNPTGITLTQTLDQVGNRLVLQDNFVVTTNTWDVQSRLTLIQNPYNELTTMQWDGLGREYHRVLANGMNTSHARDAAGRETQLVNANAAGTWLFAVTNTYSANDNRIGVVELDGTVLTYGYDASSQLTSEARNGAYAYNTTYVWDPNGNRSQQYDSGILTQRTFNAANELTLVTPSSGPPTTNLYDPNGNLATATTGSAVTTNTWSPEDRLAAYTKSSGASNQYTYSDDGKRKSEGTGLGATIFTYDDGALMLETDIAGNLQARYTNYPGIYGGLASMRRGSDSSFYGYDTQHSTRILTSPGETVSDEYSYTAFGIPLQPGSGTVNPFQFIGLFLYYTDDDGEVFVGPRILVVIDGRWMPGDANLHTSDQRNPYRFSPSFATRNVDPMPFDVAPFPAPPKTKFHQPATIGEIRSCLIYAQGGCCPEGSSDSPRLPRKLQREGIDDVDLLICIAWQESNLNHPPTKDRMGKAFNFVKTDASGCGTEGIAGFTDDAFDYLKGQNNGQGCYIVAHYRDACDFFKRASDCEKAIASYEYLRCNFNIAKYGPPYDDDLVSGMKDCAKCLGKLRCDSSSDELKGMECLKKVHS